MFAVMEPTHEFLIQPISEDTSEEVRAQWAARAEEQRKGGARANSGVDLPMPADLVVPPAATCKKAVKVGLGVRAVCLRVIKGPDGSRKVTVPFRMIPRSSISKTTLTLANCEGLFDLDYRGEVIAAFHNVGAEPVVIKKGCCLLQLVASDLMPPAYSLLEEGDIRATYFAKTARGAGGFGSSGATATD